MRNSTICLFIINCPQKQKFLSFVHLLFYLSICPSLCLSVRLYLNPFSNHIALHNLSYKFHDFDFNIEPLSPYLKAILFITFIHEPFVVVLLGFCGFYVVNMPLLLLLQLWPVVLVVKVFLETFKACSINFVSAKLLASFF